MAVIAGGALLGGEAWPTPSVTGNNNRVGVSEKSGDGIATAVRNWLTPNVMDSLDPRSAESLAEYQERSRPGRTTAPTLREQVMEDKHWQTPSSGNFRTRGGDRADELGLDNQVKQAWATPTAHAANHAKPYDQGGQPVSYQVEKWATPQQHDNVKGAAKRVGRFGTAAGGRNLTDEVVHPDNQTPTEEERAEWQKRRKVFTSEGDQMRYETSDEYWSRMNSRPEMDAHLQEGTAWPTPVQEDSQGTGMRHNGGGSPLNAVVRQEQNWATPKAHASGADFARANREGSGGDDLETQLRKQTWPTPKERDKKTPLVQETFDRRSEESSRGIDLNEAVAQSDGREMQRLNPDWEELLMGWPIGWTNPHTPPCSWPGFPMGQGAEQFDYEPPRTVHKDECPNRTKRVSSIGNGVVRQCAEMAYFILILEALGK